MSNDININFALFAEATRRKLRFPIGGSISVEDVWDLPLKPRGNRPEPSLNELAQILTDQVEKLPKRNFIDDDEEQAAKADPTHLATKLEIVLAVIRVKKAEAKAKEGAVAQASQLSELDALIARKRQDALANLSLEELEKRRSEIAAKV
jgi:hypothetical protein